MKREKQVSRTGLPKTSGLDVYTSVTIINEQVVLMPVVMTDKFGNVHSVIKTTKKDSIT
jgi:hypothetical protein|tara:strand:+ start:280 stop:456 length:177 start_codon:yes stop_codon:yes gene_type:complete